MRIVLPVAGLALFGLLATGFGPAANPIRFELSYLSATLENHPTPRRHLIETMAGGVAAFDYDGDGRIDIFLTNGAPIPTLAKAHPGDDNRLFRNEGGMTFKDVTAQSGLAGEGYAIGAAAADYDNDGRPDLFVAGVNGSHLYHNEGGRFADVTARAGLRTAEWAVHAVWLDYNRDGLLDLFVVNYLRWSAESSPVCHAPNSAMTVYCDPREVSGLPNRLYRNRGDGTFEDVSVTSGIASHIGKGMSAAAADYDGDGYPDIYVTNDTVPNFLFHNLGNGKFEEVALEAGVSLPTDGRPVSSMGTDFRDFNNDGRPDIAFTALAGQTFPLFQNVGRGAFRDVTFASRLGPLSIRRSGWGVVFADFDNDGWKDLFTSGAHVTDNIDQLSGDRYRLANAIFRNLGNGSFADVSGSAGGAFQKAAAHRGVAVADFDGDGRLDAVVSVLGGAPELWRNVTEAAGSWAAFQLEGRRSNRDGIGAEIRWNGQMNHMTTSQGYASSTLVPVHFGLGRAPGIGTVEIRWPSGRVQILPNPPANRITHVVEPD
ncbi:MAG: CRTAC1 family protein [Acidobacteria bacterium]|nr:CRTAC1 family protein [Acidobacteriota bacterium]